LLVSARPLLAADRSAAAGRRWPPLLAAGRRPLGRQFNYASANDNVK